jgi:hypothetical protein
MKARVSTPTLWVVREGPLVGLPESFFGFVDPILGIFRDFNLVVKPRSGGAAVFLFF